jgi:serine phosphatase RsbU (regulator of sigma subunit)
VAAPTGDGLATLSVFGLHAGAALRASEGAAELGGELDRTRALLRIVAGVTADLSLSHALETFVERVSEVLGPVRLAVYLREDGRLSEAVSRGLAGPHTPIAERLLDIALSRRNERGTVEIHAAARDLRLAGLEDALAETGIDAAAAVPLTVAGEITGVVAIYPPSGRLLTDTESGLLVAVAAQVAIAVSNARLHEKATQLGTELEAVLDAERKTARHLRSLYEISRSFAQSLSLETTLEAVARAVVELLDVDAALIRMPDPRGEQLVPRALHVADVRLGGAIRSILSRPQSLEKLPGRRLFLKREALVLDAATATRLGGGYELLSPFLEKGSTAVALPIATPTELLGTLTLLSLDPARPITPETTQIGLSVAAQAALAVENARLYQQQKAFADTMQRSLLPRSRPEHPGLELGAVYESSARLDVGGDVYDFLRLEDGRLAVVLGDVTGHGIDAAADMAMAKFVFRSLAREHPDPGDFLAAANEVVCGEISAAKFITMVYVTIDAARGEAACAIAGHPQPRLVRTDGTVAPLEARGLALGIEEDQRYEEVRAALPPGATVVLYTDGVVEARRGAELYGAERLDAVLAEHRDSSADQIAQAILADCRSFAGGELGDDCALVVIKRTG